MRCKREDGRTWTETCVRTVRERLGIAPFDPTAVQHKTVSMEEAARPGHLHRLGPPLDPRQDPASDPGDALGTLADSRNRTGLRTGPAFLQCGARGVIDLAWPVFDLVEALVCERYGLLRGRLALSVNKALTQALLWTQHLLADWADARAEHIGVRSALAWLDQARRAGVIAMGGDPAWVNPYAA